MKFMKKILLVSALTICGFLQARTQAQVAADYKIAPNDILVVDVFGEKDLSREVRVTASGKINMFLLDEVEVAGKTTTEVKDLLTKLLDKDFLVDPQVAVDVKEYRIREVFVNGGVNKPGSISLSGEQSLTILGALARAGGLSPRANEKKIKFTRPGVMEKNFTMEELKRETDPTKVITLQPGDIIEVADKLI
jgi:protein involved in polysaccharide export with SLBB domain